LRSELEVLRDDLALLVSNVRQALGRPASPVT
jgi:hypothetical protein